MKKIMLGLVAAAALISFTAPVFAADDAAAGDAKPAKKGKKKGKKAEGDAAGDAAPAADAKPAK
jgi:hypothetical protein